MGRTSSSTTTVRAATVARAGRADIFMSIKPEHINNIATRAKNHEYRRYILPSSVRRIWFYTTAPFSRVEYVARISRGKIPGEVPEDGGIGNEDFNAGRELSEYGYEILDLWKLKQPISLKLAVSKGYMKGPPQKYCRVPLSLLESCPLDRQDHIISASNKYPVERKQSQSAEAPQPSPKSTE
ncbi:uncharacterized protein BHQ10_009216 [Talaromyces amestolkiae]|uniref:EVE domain-containing protein n=1 Tax=Talaromyces amestolkiae TaxID=1196081 RepID=A0A364LBL8_TALAM|nr:uncharacterized protein BHQ10_009216 [Talaromyces amestolkiae]RAO73204.1 hypothetical protein BHQ10_009216 [Talaromyces amestolkiae]